jgi:hypothetical protein
MWRRVTAVLENEVMSTSSASAMLAGRAMQHVVQPGLGQQILAEFGRQARYFDQRAMERPGWVRPRRTASAPSARPKVA